MQIKFSKLNAVKASKRARFSLKEIKYIETHLQLNPRDRAILETQKQMRIAQPVKCLVAALIAIPFGAASGRRNVTIGVAASIFICLGYFVLQQLDPTWRADNSFRPLLARGCPMRFLA